MTQLPRSHTELLRRIRNLNDGGLGKCIARVETLARFSKWTPRGEGVQKQYSVNTIKTARARLRREGYIEVTRKGPSAGEIVITAEGRAYLDRLESRRQLATPEVRTSAGSTNPQVDSSRECRQAPAPRAGRPTPLKTPSTQEYNEKYNSCHVYGTRETTPRQQASSTPEESSPKMAPAGPDVVSTEKPNRSGKSKPIDLSNPIVKAQLGRLSQLGVTTKAVRRLMTTTSQSHLSAALILAHRDLENKRNPAGYLISAASGGFRIPKSVWKEAREWERRQLQTAESRIPVSAPGTCSGSTEEIDVSWGACGSTQHDATPQPARSVTRFVGARLQESSCPEPRERASDATVKNALAQMRANLNGRV